MKLEEVVHDQLEAEGHTVDTLQTGYPHVHAYGKDKRQGMHPCAATCHCSSGTRLPA
jgi:hypothetical protein